MLYFVLVVFVVVILPMIALALINGAPEGYEYDETGFHYGKENDHE